MLVSIRKILKDVAAKDRCDKVRRDPPELLPEILGLMRQGYDVVFAQRRARPGDGIWKSSTSAAFYWLNNDEIGGTLAKRGLVAESSHRATTLRDRSVPVGI